MVARRHMHEFGTTSEQLAWIKVAASHHAQYNPNAMLRDVVTVDDVLEFADDCRSAAPARLLRHQRRRRRGHSRTTRNRALIEAAAGESASAQAKRSRASSAEMSTSLIPAPRVLGRRRSTKPGSSRATSIRLDLRQLHHHRAHAARRPRLLREGSGRPFRRRRQSDFRHRQAALQHRWRRPLQQPSRPIAAA